MKATSITSTAPADGRIDQTTFRSLMSHWATGVGVVHGDHVILVGDVIEGELRGPASPLIFFRSAYADGVAVRFGSSELQASDDVVGP